MARRCQATGSSLWITHADILYHPVLHLPVFAVVDFESFFKKYSNAEAVYRPGKNAKVEFYHAVVLVGYNNDHNPPYWVAKNSYGPGWGDDGFFKV